MWNAVTHQLVFLNKRVLSIGPRDGQYERTYVTQADALTIIEPDEAGLDAFQANWDAALEPTYLHATLQEAELPANSFDIILLHRSY